jgi:hypothetical protein
MNYLLKRIGLFIYGIISVLESVANFSLYISHLDFFIKPVDWAMPFYFWYVNKFPWAGHLEEKRRMGNVAQD